MTATDQPSDRETGLALDPKFDAQGLITAVVVDASTREPLMLAHMNADALDRTIETRIAHFYSRSRAALWQKGETSGNRLLVRAMRIDCDQDAVWIEAEIEGSGAACHTGRRSCFYRRIASDGSLEMTGDQPIFNPEDVYGGDR